MKFIINLNRLHFRNPIQDRSESSQVVYPVGKLNAGMHLRYGTNPRPASIPMICCISKWKLNCIFVGITRLTLVLFFCLSSCTLYTQILPDEKDNDRSFESDKGSILGRDTSQREGNTDAEPTVADVVQIDSYLKSDFVKIASGSFMLGTSESELIECRGKYNEDLVEVVLTNPFEISKYEVTQKIWKAAGFPNPVENNSVFAEILDDERPVVLVDWYEALAFCNRLSKHAGFEECYDLSNCTGDSVGSGCPPSIPYISWEKGGCFWDLQNLAKPYWCGYPVRRYESMYDCPGYRLPTSAEWEYAARAKTTTHTYNGNIENTDSWKCYVESVLEPIAWYCANTSNYVVQPVGLKLPNQWGLYDMLGNVAEWTDAIYTGGGLAEDEWYASGQTPPIVNPSGHRDDGKLLERIVRGSYLSLPSCNMRAAHVFGGNTGSSRYVDLGFRPVRTLPLEKND